jgi:hypothetical protein
VRRAVVIAVAAAAIAGAAWSAQSAPRHSPAAVGRWETPTELAWIRKLSLWRTEILQSYAQVSCAKTLRAVGPPPTRRMWPGFRLVKLGCRGLNADADTATLDFDIFTMQVGIRMLRLGDAIRLPWGDADRDVRRASYRDRDVGRAASAIAGKHVEALCWSPRDWRGLNAETVAFDPEFHAADTVAWARIEGREINFSPTVCRAFEELLASSSADLEADAAYWGDVVDVVAHEAEHTRGLGDEAETECYAIQMIPKTTAAFGFSAAAGRAIAHAYWQEYDQEPRGYASDQCHDAGAYDLNVDTSRWP